MSPRGVPLEWQHQRRQIERERPHLAPSHTSPAGNSPNRARFSTAEPAHFSHLRAFWAATIVACLLFASLTTLSLSRGTANSGISPSVYPWGVAVNKTTNHIYVALMNRDRVAVVDGSTHALLYHIPVGHHPVDVAVNPASNRIYVSNRLSNTVSVIDGGTDDIIATVPLGQAPWAVAVDSTMNRVYVTNRGDGSLSVIDGEINSVITTIDVDNDPAGIAVDAEIGRVYVTNRGGGTISIVDSVANQVIKTIPGGAFAWGAAVNPRNHFLYVAMMGSGTVDVIDGPAGQLAILPAATEARGLGLNSAQFDTYFFIRAQADPTAVTLNPLTQRLYVSNRRTGTVSVIDAVQNSGLTAIPVGLDPGGIALNVTTNQVYVVNRRSDSLSVIDGTTNDVIATVSLSHSNPPPIDITLQPIESMYYKNASGRTSRVRSRV